MGRQYLISAQAEPLRTVAFGGIGAAYAVLGAPLANPSRLIIFTNDTDADVTVSLDGVDDHFIILKQSFKLLDIATNKSVQDGFYFRQGTQFYQKRTAGAPSTGSLYFETIFAG